MSQKSSINISKKAFLSSVAIIFSLMILAGILTRVLPQGSFERTLVGGREAIVAGSYTQTDTQRLSVLRWFTAPFEVPFSSDGTVVLVIIAFIFIIGGTIATLDRCGLLKYCVDSLVSRFAGNKYRLLEVLVLVFMLMGSVMGIMEEVIALAPIIVALAYALNWDSLTGLGMSALSAGIGFAAATINPFTIGIAQSIMGLPTFSGLLVRIPIFIVSYLILVTFIKRYARKIDKNPEKSLVYQEDKQNRSKYIGAKQAFEKSLQMSKALSVLVITIIVMLFVIILGMFVPLISSISMPLMALIFLIGGIIAIKTSKYKGNVPKDYLGGILGIAPGAVLILMAMSVKLIITNGGVMDTVLYYITSSINSASPFWAAILIYVFVLIFNFFVASGSAKAFLILPIIAPLTELLGVTKQVAVQAFAFGDGFSNMIYPTNPALLIALSLTVVSYPKWFKWTIPLQLIFVCLSVICLLLCVAFNFGPF